MNLYFYKVMYDNGGAPAVEDGLLSLAICKPRIRSTCRDGDVIFGFGSNTRNKRHHLIYVAKITDKLPGCTYYDSVEYKHRRDNIYERDAITGVYRWKKGSKHHDNGSLLHIDLGEPPDYKNANVLLSSEFRYFGKNSLTIDQLNGTTAKFSELKETLDNLKQGHRFNHDGPVKEQLKVVCELAFQYAENQENLPTDSDGSKSCADDEGDCYIETD